MLVEWYNGSEEVKDGEEPTLQFRFVAGGAYEDLDHRRMRWWRKQHPKSHFRQGPKLTSRFCAYHVFGCGTWLFNRWRGIHEA